MIAKTRQRPLMEFELNADMIGEGLTQSEMQCWDNCPEKWYLGYNLRLTKKGKFAWALTYGSWIHASLEEFYRTKGKRWAWNPDLKHEQISFMTQASLAKKEYYEKLGQIQMEVYANRYKHDPTFFDVHATEEIMDIEFEGVRLKGMIDVLVYSKALKGFFVIDHKTTSRLDAKVIEGWDFRLQFMFYCWLARRNPTWKDKPVKGYIINAMKKPALKQGINEGLPTFLERCRIDMIERDDKYFYREPLILKKGDMDHFENEILRPKIQRVKMLFDPSVSPSVKGFLVRNKNTDHCLTYGQPCEFLQVCKHGMALEKNNFFVRTNKHEELAEEIE